jgi:hypothetical protein
MTPKEKARELVSKCWLIDGIEFLLEAKQCALIAVDEIDDIYQKLTPKDDPYCFLSELEYWQNVKQHIQRL